MLTVVNTEKCTERKIIKGFKGVEYYNMQKGSWKHDVICNSVECHNTFETLVQEEEYVD